MGRDGRTGYQGGNAVFKITTQATLFMKHKDVFTLVNKVESPGRRAALGSEPQHDLVRSGQRQGLACNTE